jgi:hypothetical protein
LETRLMVGFSNGFLGILNPSEVVAKHWEHHKCFVKQVLTLKGREGGLHKQQISMFFQKYVHSTC